MSVHACVCVCVCTGMISKCAFTEAYISYITPTLTTLSGLFMLPPSTSPAVDYREVPDIQVLLNINTFPYPILDGCLQNIHPLSDLLCGQ